MNSLPHAGNSEPGRHDADLASTSTTPSRRQFPREHRLGQLLGTVAGNGGDWFELVVVRTISTCGDGNSWSSTTRRAGRVDDPDADQRRDPGPICAAAPSSRSPKIWPDDISYDPASGDWWINLRPAAAATGIYISGPELHRLEQEHADHDPRRRGAARFRTGGGGDPAAERHRERRGVQAGRGSGPDITPLATTTTAVEHLRRRQLWNAGAIEQDFRRVTQCCTDELVRTAIATTAIRARTTLASAICARTTPNTAVCDDGNPCTRQRRMRLRAMPRRGHCADCCFTDCECDDGDPCTADRCVAPTSASTTSLRPARACDDGDLCTESDVCDLGSCGGTGRGLFALEMTAM